MRFLLVILIYSFLLPGCAYYGDIHGHSRKLTLADLNTQRIYLPPKNFSPPRQYNWWHTFHDAQLDQLIQIALCDSPDMQIAQARVSRARYLSQEAASFTWPYINFSGYVQRQRFAEFGLVPPPFNGKTFNIGTAGLNFNYEFDFWGKNRETLRARLNEECAILAELAQARLVLSAAVAETYFQLLRNIEQVRIAQINLDLTRNIFAISANLARHGINSQIPVKQNQESIQTASIILEQYKQAESLSRHQLAVLLGKNPFTTDMETKKFVYHQYRIKLPICLTANLLAVRPDVYAAKLRVIAAAARINVAKAYFFPDINLNAFTTYESIHLNNLFAHENQNNAITGAVDLPIFDANRRRANLGEKYAEYDIAVNQYNQTLLKSLQEASDQLAILKSTNIEIREQNIALQASRHSDRLFTLQYNHGITPYLQVLKSRQTLMQRQSEQVDMQARYLQAMVATLKSFGGNDLMIQG